MMDNWTDHFTDEEQELLRAGLRHLVASLSHTGNRDGETASAAKDLLRKLDGAPAVQ